jgi:hypothetical protein
VWSYPEIADAVALGLQRHAAASDLEQAVHGLDSLDELSLHPVLSESLRAAGFGAFREQRYPADRHRRRISEGERCDLVVTHDNRQLVAPDRAPTLFDPPDAVPLEDACWLEVKVVAQYTHSGPNTAYASQLLGGVGHDVAKLSKDPGILHAGLLIVLWTAEEHVAGHDLDVWHQRCIARGLPIETPCRRAFGIADRIGNASGSIALYPVRHL